MVPNIASIIKKKSSVQLFSDLKIYGNRSNKKGIPKKGVILTYKKCLTMQEKLRNKKYKDKW